MRLLLAIFIILSFISCSSDEVKYDETSQQKPVQSYHGIDSVLSTLEHFSYKSLPVDYLEASGNIDNFKSMVKNGNFYQLKNTDIYKYIVGSIRIKNFVAHDKYYRQNASNASASYQQYWLIDKQLLYKVLDLQNALTKAAYNPNGFTVRDGHRYPTYNQLRGGASRSQHIAGKATDIVIHDINLDGIEDQTDKDIVLEILENEVIKNKGGIGRYPGSMVIHFDVRGKRARWDKQ